jgi:DNA-binding MarR family transcriptional regulator
MAGDLAAHSGRDKAQVARLLSGLKDLGLIESRADEADRRRQLVHLTSAGQALHSAMQLQVRHVARRSLEGLSGDDRQKLLELLQRVRSNLEGGGNGA